MDNKTEPAPHHELHRSFGLLQATAMNMSNMIGVGPFLTIPLILASMGGPQAVLGWIAGAALAICDGMVWAELASAIPASGGTLEYLKVGYAGTRLGRLLPFLFIWQFILSGPLEIASGYIGFAHYASYFLPMTPLQVQLLAVGTGVLTVFLLYRKIESVGKLMVALWVGAILAIAIILVAGIRNFDPKLAFDFPPGAFTFSTGFFFGLGSAMLWAMYDFLGYYSVCYIGDEVKRPARTIPRSILFSVVVVAAIYLAMNESFIGGVPWREAIKSQFIASEFMERLYGRTAGVLISVLICWSALAAVFALMLGYSRIPFAAARDGFFFSAFAKLHPRGDFPHVSLLVLGGVSIGASLFSLDAVICAMVTSRILIQFIAQIAAVQLIRRRRDVVAGFKMPLYPLPSLIALVGWIFVLGTSGIEYVAGGLGTLAAGAVAYWAWTQWGQET
jgi:basic amino acid/polyamine antiporter, APA family